MHIIADVDVHELAWSLYVCMYVCDVSFFSLCSVFLVVYTSILFDIIHMHSLYVSVVVGWFLNQEY